jgi:hypothetical protein
MAPEIDENEEEAEKEEQFFHHEMNVLNDFFFYFRPVNYYSRVFSKRAKHHYHYLPRANIKKKYASLI